MLKVFKAHEENKISPELLSGKTHLRDTYKIYVSGKLRAGFRVCTVSESMEVNWWLKPFSKTLIGEGFTNILKTFQPHWWEHFCSTMGAFAYYRY